MGEIQNFIEREDRIKKYSFWISIVATISIIINAFMHDYTGELIYLFLMICASVSAFGFCIIGYLIQIQNKIIGLLGFIIESTQEEEVDTTGIIKKIVPQFKKILEKELKQ